jgi:hypothetical protein
MAVCEILGGDIAGSDPGPVAEVVIEGHPFICILSESQLAVVGSPTAVPVSPSILAALTLFGSRVCEARRLNPGRASRAASAEEEEDWRDIPSAPIPRLI